MRPTRLLSIPRWTFRTVTVPGRRLFLKGTAAVWFAGVLGIGCNDAQTSDESAAGDPQAANLRLLVLVAGAVLPSKIGPEEHRRIAETFSVWLAEHDPSAEPLQRAAYDYTPNAGLTPYPRSRIDRDLREIESSATQQFSRSFADLELVEQQDLLRSLLAERPIGTLRGSIYRQDGHVVLSLLDFYYHFNIIHRSGRRK